MDTIIMLGLCMIITKLVLISSKKSFAKSFRSIPSINEDEFFVLNNIQKTNVYDIRITNCISIKSFVKYITCKLYAKNLLVKSKAEYGKELFTAINNNEIENCSHEEKIIYSWYINGNEIENILNNKEIKKAYISFLRNTCRNLRNKQIINSGYSVIKVINKIFIGVLVISFVLVNLTLPSVYYSYGTDKKEIFILVAKIINLFLLLVNIIIVKVIKRPEIVNSLGYRIIENFTHESKLRIRDVKDIDLSNVENKRKYYFDLMVDYAINPFNKRLINDDKGAREDVMGMIYKKKKMENTIFVLVTISLIFISMFVL